jgi:hypothetical protein
MRSRHLALLAAAVLVASACGGDDGDGDAGDPTAVTSVVTSVAASTSAAPATTAAAEPVSTSTPVTSADTTTPVTATPIDAGWRNLVLEGCVCSGGEPLTMYERPADPTKVVLFFEGGGACFDATTCDPDGNPSYTVDRDGLSATNLEHFGGLFDFDNPENPLASYSWIYVPYCTGDVHIGNTTHDYGNGVVIEHRGQANGVAALEHLVGAYPQAEQVVVTGQSAGSVPTAQFAGLIADRLPEAAIVTFGDSSGAYPDVDGVSGLIGEVWGVMDALPDWPETAGITPADWSFPEQYILAGRHAPRIRFGRFDFAYDEVQAFFGSLAGAAADELVSVIDATEAQIEAGGVAVATYVAPGTSHVVSGDQALYTTEVDGVRLIDWLAELIEGETPPADVHCTDCQPPG